MSDDTFNEMADEILALRARVSELEGEVEALNSDCEAMAADRDKALGRVSELEGALRQIVPISRANSHAIYRIALAALQEPSHG